MPFDMPAHDKQSLIDFVRGHGITEVECLIPDMSGVARGKVLPAEKFLTALGTNGLRLPEAVFVSMVNGVYPEGESITDRTIRSTGS